MKSWVFSQHRDGHRNKTFLNSCRIENPNSPQRDPNSGIQTLLSPPSHKHLSPLELLPAGKNQKYLSQRYPGLQQFQQVNPSSQIFCVLFTNIQIFYSKIFRILFTTLPCFIRKYSVFYSLKSMKKMLPATAKLEKRKNSSLFFPGKAGAEGDRWLSELPIRSVAVNWICTPLLPQLLRALGAFSMILPSWKMLPEPFRIPKKSFRVPQKPLKNSLKAFWNSLKVISNPWAM